MTIAAAPEEAVEVNWATQQPYQATIDCTGVRDGPVVLRGLRVRHSSPSIANNYAVKLTVRGPAGRWLGWVLGGWVDGALPSSCPATSVTPLVNDSYALKCRNVRVLHGGCWVLSAGYHQGGAASKRLAAKLPGS